MADSRKLFQELQGHWDAFVENDTAFVEKGNKAAAGRARKSLGEIKKLVTEYRKASVEECKS